MSSAALRSPRGILKLSAIAAVLRMVIAIPTAAEIRKPPCLLIIPLLLFILAFMARTPKIMPPSARSQFRHRDARPEVRESAERRGRTIRHHEREKSPRSCAARWRHRLQSILRDCSD